LFAGGDVVTGPNTVVDAIAAGKKAAVMIHRYLSGEELQQPGDGARPSLIPVPGPEKTTGMGCPKRPAIPHLAASERRSTYAEVEQVIDEEVARSEASRCLRCDLEFSSGGPSSGGRG
ncbi:MAG: hypothetical protein HN348_20970, partial [Proteobacteria bacterium]|nr:hypothetical protein [Pseudomonadota bacterium]